MRRTRRIWRIHCRPEHSANITGYVTQQWPAKQLRRVTDLILTQGKVASPTCCYCCCYCYFSTSNLARVISIQTSPPRERHGTYRAAETTAVSTSWKSFKEPFLLLLLHMLSGETEMESNQKFNQTQHPNNFLLGREAREVWEVWGCAWRWYRQARAEAAYLWRQGPSWSTAVIRCADSSYGDHLRRSVEFPFLSLGRWGSTVWCRNEPK